MKQTRVNKRRGCRVDSFKWSAFTQGARAEKQLLNTLDDAASHLHEAHALFLDAYEAAVLEALSHTERRALEGSLKPGEAPDRLPLLQIVDTHASLAVETILRSDPHLSVSTYASKAVLTAAAAISVALKESKKSEMHNRSESL
jgi:hypothetical protein